MSNQPTDDNMSLLADIGRALKVAEREDAKQRHGSTLPEYEAARRLGEGLAAELETQVTAVRDLSDNAGLLIVMSYRNKDHGLTLSFDELKHASNDPDENEDLYDRWRKDLRSNSTLIADPAETVRGKARPTKQRLAAAR